MKYLNSSRTFIATLVIGIVCSCAWAAGPVEVYFSPKDRCDQKLITELNKAQKTLDIAIYSFCKDDIAEAVISANQRGVAVRMIVDRQQAGGKYSQDERLRVAGIPVLEDTHQGLMHNKFVVIDGATVLTGSYNWTNGATYKNDENLLIIRDADIASKYATEFSTMLQANAVKTK